MDRKSSGIDFDREAFVTPAPRAPHGDSRWPGVLLLLVAVVALGLLGYKFLIQDAVNDSGSDSRTLAQIDQRMAGIEDRLQRIEQDRDRPPATFNPNPKRSDASASNSASSDPSPRPVYRISPPPVSQQPARSEGPAVDPAIAQKVAGIQQGLGSLQQNAAADHESWQATTDRLADVSGQVGNQQLQLLRSQDELNQLLARTQRTAIPFELHRGADHQSVGPISFTLKSTNTKTQRYTLCAYVQEGCVELKERNRYEVVQFVTSRYSSPLEVIATAVLKDGITGYLEVPTDKTAH
jgi:hypothetical protein